MKKNFYIVTLLFLGLFLSSCEETDIAHDNDFEKSYSIWLTFKKSSGNSYRYIVNSGAITGNVWETQITVREGKVAERSFKYLLISSPGSENEQDKEWLETAEELGSHQSSPAAEALTLDEIYNRARTVWLLKRENVETYFEAKNNGLISACGYIDRSCATNCANGVIIRMIEKL